ncbi:MAG: hypothetical protein U5L96_13785 [Owenweeksia sp.]|nr:hypothetical protein [Owenweeksia sp.]
MATPHIVKLQKLYEPPGQNFFTDSRVPMAVLLEGKFQSAFKNQITPSGDAGARLQLIEKSVPTQQLIVADGDIIKNQLNVLNPNIPKGAPLPLGADQYTGAQYGNEDFLLNAIDYLLDDSGLIDIRSRELKIRLLDVQQVKEQKLLWQLVNTALPIALIILFGRYT